MTAFLMLLVGLVIGIPAGAYLVHRNLAPRLAQLKQENQTLLATAQDAEAKWLELVSLLDDNGQLPKGAA